MVVKAYVVLSNGTQLTNGLVDFKDFVCNNPVLVTILPSVEACLQYLKDDNCICEFELVNPEELVYAVNAAVYGDSSYSRYHVKWLNVYTKKSLAA